jgi:hypothetical protein
VFVFLPATFTKFKLLIAGTVFVQKMQNHRGTLCPVLLDLKRSCTVSTLGQFGQPLSTHCIPENNRFFIIFIIFYSFSFVDYWTGVFTFIGP